MSGVAAEIINDPDALAALEPEWWDLWRRLPNALPFQTPAWLLPWWRHFHPGELFVLAARQQGRLIGLAPGYIEDGPLGRRIMPLGISLSDHLDILVDPRASDAALAGLVSAACSSRDRWEIWELEELPSGSAALNLPLPPFCEDTVDHQSSCPVLKLEAVENLPSLFPKPKRQNLNTARNRAARRGVVTISREAGEALAHAFEQMVRLHGARWENRGEPGLLHSDAVLAFHLGALPELDRSGLLRFYTLAIEGQVIAAYYGLAASSCAYVYLTGFDPAFSFESPGVILLAHAIKQAVSEGCREIDFLRGQEAYKYEWGAVDRWNLKRSIRQIG